MQALSNLLLESLYILIIGWSNNEKMPVLSCSKAMDIVANTTYCTIRTIYIYIYIIFFEKHCNDYSTQLIRILFSTSQLAFTNDYHSRLQQQNSIPTRPILPLSFCYIPLSSSAPLSLPAHTLIHFVCLHNNNHNSKNPAIQPYPAAMQSCSLSNASDTEHDRRVVWSPANSWRTSQNVLLSQWQKCPWTPSASIVFFCHGVFSWRCSPPRGRRPSQALGVTAVQIRAPNSQDRIHVKGKHVRLKSSWGFVAVHAGTVTCGVS